MSPARLVQLSQLFGCGVEDLFRDPVAPGSDTPLPVPGRRSLHLVQNDERIRSPELQREIGALVWSLAERETLAWLALPC